MSIIRFAGFLGANQALEPKMLPDTVGVESLNQKPGRGDLRPWKAPLNVATVPSGRKTIYRMGRDVPSDTNYWLSWPTDVHCVVGGNAKDTAERTYYTGDGTPKWTDTTKALATAPYPTSHREMGIPAPGTACLLSATSSAVPATSVQVTKATTQISIVNNQLATITTSEPHGFLAGEYATVSLVWTVASVNTLFYDVLPIMSVPSANTFVIRGSSAGWSNVPSGTPGVGTAVVWKEVAAVEPETETRFYTYTFVSDNGDEGAPNPAPTRVTCEIGATVTISNLGNTPTGNYGINRQRIYRTQAGTDGTADFYFVKEITSTATTTTDTSGKFGEVLTSKDWLPAPGIPIVDGDATTDPVLTNLTGLWNGMMAGISGRSVRFCVAYTYYAWPYAYEIVPTNAKPVALATFGQTLVMLTDGNPSVITGGSPDAMDEQPVEFNQACVATKSAVGMGHGVAWASPDGQAYIGSSGAKLLTEGMMTRDDWQALDPSGIVGCMYERRYIGFYAGGTKAFMIDPVNPNGIYFMDFGADAVHVDDLQDALFVLQGVNIAKFDHGTALTTTFKSKVFHQPKPMSAMACAQVTGNQTTGSPATFKLYADGVLKFTKTVTDSKPFRLPSGYKASDFQIEVSTTSAIQSVAMANSMQELSTT